MANISMCRNDTSELNQSIYTPTTQIEILATLAALNIFLSITASLSNALILAALRKETTLHSPTKLLFRSLAFTDLCAGFISQLLFAASLVSDIAETNRDIKKIIAKGIYVSSYIFCVISILTSTALSVDRLLALLLGLRYRHVVTLKRVRVFITCSWLVGVTCGLAYFSGTNISLIVVSTVSILSLTTSVISYTKIYLTLRGHQAQVQGHVHQGQPNGGGIPLNIARYKRTVSSLLWIQLALLACYVPFSIMSSLKSSRRKYYTVCLATVTLVYLNSSMNPILYCWKIRSVRKAVKDTIRQLCC